MCDAVTPVAVAPSPNCHAYAVIDPSSSPDGLASKVHSSSAQLAAKSATGGWLAPCTVTLAVAEDVAPRSSVTVTVTGYVPPRGKACVTAAPEALPPPPNDHVVETSTPSGSCEPVLRKVQTSSSHSDTSSATGLALGVWEPSPE
ncbi:hypothetical protein PS9374_07193 [Planomonospora sphaerica]|uniref:Uncharacterized protein n=1 Tax=Planomonospora sphaerica TaxID=161355 RepID=A0A171DR25_9ACTN|nr:hypothetical protein PS9374_07193 [Planomonospora sphaerica]